MLRKLVALAFSLNRLGRKVEAGKVAALAGGVFMHIGGPAGSGKTSLLEEIEAKYPQIICKDLDEFDQEAEEILGLNPNWKGSEELWERWGEESYRIKQDLLDRFISSHLDQKIILAGIESEGEYSLQIYPQHSILLDTSAAESLSRRIKRDKEIAGNSGFWDDPESLESELQENEKIIQDLTSSGYLSLSPDQVMELIDKEMNNLDKLAAYNKPRNGKKRWSVKYKRKINCSNPKGFSQKAYRKRKGRGGGYKGE
mgnify:CR=1 FL=1